MRLRPKAPITMREAAGPPCAASMILTSGRPSVDEASRTGDGQRPQQVAGLVEASHCPALVLRVDEQVHRARCSRVPTCFHGETRRNARAGRPVEGEQDAPRENCGATSVPRSRACWSCACTRVRRSSRSDRAPEGRRELPVPTEHEEVGAAWRRSTIRSSGDRLDGISVSCTRHPGSCLLGDASRRHAASARAREDSRSMPSMRRRRDTEPLIPCRPLHHAVLDHRQGRASRGRSRDVMRDRKAAPRHSPPRSRPSPAGSSQIILLSAHFRLVLRSRSGKPSRPRGAGPRGFASGASSQAQPCGYRIRIPKGLGLPTRTDRPGLTARDSSSCRPSPLR